VHDAGFAGHHHQHDSERWDPILHSGLQVQHPSSRSWRGLDPVPGLIDWCCNTHAISDGYTSDTDAISDGHTSDADTYATHTHADLESGDNTYATTTHTHADPESWNNTYATTIHTHADPKPGDNTEPNTISDGHTGDADTNSDSGGAGRQPVDEDERADRR
jgi:hypothetical protein